MSPARIILVAPAPAEDTRARRRPIHRQLTSESTNPRVGHNGTAYDRDISDSTVTTAATRHGRPPVINVRFVQDSSHYHSNLDLAILGHSWHCMGTRRGNRSAPELSACAGEDKRFPVFLARWRDGCGKQTVVGYTVILQGE
ncbi:hypothetical protein J6590_047036 [Homalodisca vitripennis]|nr:hypothetical protein J6590_047036 [Homalodisca vitripennis]